MVYVKFSCGNKEWNQYTAIYKCFDSISEPITERDRNHLDTRSLGYAIEYAIQKSYTTIGDEKNFSSGEEYMKTVNKYYDDVLNNWEIVSKKEYDENKDAVTIVLCREKVKEV